MDEIWQRHKTFILQCVIGGIVFLIALAVMGNMYSGADTAQGTNEGLRKDLLKKTADGQAPSSSSITAQKQKAQDAQQQIKNMAAQVASLATGEDYLRENIGWVLAIIGKPRADTERFLSIYKNVSPNTCLTSMREEARAVLVARAAQKGKSIDEQFGLAAGVEDEDVPGGLHALAIVCDVVRRALDRDGIQSVGDIRVQPRNVLDRDLPWIAGIEVKLSLVGDPDDVMAVIRGFNNLDSHPSRMTVVKEIESISRRNPDDDVVKASVVLYGLQHKGVGE